MELVYLWVKNYKNIVEQGFNFSPRFRCEYDEKTEKLEIIDKDETGEFYPKNFFGENINVTAIVGENGMGKSNLLKNIENFSKLKLYDKNHIAILKNETKLFYFSAKKIKLNKSLIELTVSNLATELEQQEIQKIFVKNDEINEQTFNEEYFNLLIKNQKIDYEFLNKNFFDSCRIKINKRKRENFLSLNNVSENSDLFSSYETELLIRKKENIFYCFEFILNEIIFTFGKYKESIIKRINSINGTNQEIIEKTKEIIITYKNEIDRDNPNYFSDEYYQKLFKLFLEFNISEFEKIYENLTKTYTTKDIKKLDELIKNNELLSYLKEKYILIYNFFDSSKDVYFNDLSDGEKRFLGFFTHLANEIKHENDDNNFILLDEPDIYLHPNWQKKFINNLINFFKINYPNKILYIFITSHSPFILSDLPKENVIFLEKGKQVYPFDDGKQTFGANIHTLLSHGFFMKDGLMGEFAKSKIDDLINYLNNKESETKNDKDTRNIIDIIGEPIIKRELQRMLKNKMELSNKTEIDTIKDEIKLLTKRLEDLEKDDK